MRLATRISRLEAKCPRPLPGCDVCRGRLIWFESQFVEVKSNGHPVPTCRSCGRVLPTPLKIIGGIDLEDVL